MIWLFGSLLWSIWSQMLVIIIFTIGSFSSAHSKRCLFVFFIIFRSCVSTADQRSLWAIALFIWRLSSVTICGSGVGSAVFSSENACKDVWHPVVFFLFVLFVPMYSGLFVSMLFYLTNCIIFFTRLILTYLFGEIFKRNRSSVGWVNERMEQGNFTDAVSLNEWKVIAFFDNRVNKCLTEVITVFEKVDDTSVSVYEHTNSSSFAKVSILWLFVRFNGIVVLPSSPSKFVTSWQIDSPRVQTSWEISLHFKSISTDSDDNFWSNLIFLKSINPPLEIVYILKIFNWNNFRLRSISNGFKWWSFHLRFGIFVALFFFTWGLWAFKTIDRYASWVIYLLWCYSFSIFIDLEQMAVLGLHICMIKPLSFDDLFDRRLFILFLDFFRSSFLFLFTKNFVFKSLDSAS